MLPDLTDRFNIICGLFDVENHLMLLNHILVMAKQTIFSLAKEKRLNRHLVK